MDVRRSCVRLRTALVACLAVSAALAAQQSASVVYQGTDGPGRGKHIVFLAGDHEYRSEETLPALARILSKRYGFKSTVIFTTNRETGFIEPGSSNISGLDALRTADVLVIFLRFQDFPDDEMQHIVDYVERGGPIVGLRTATHAFQIKRPDAKFAKYTWNNPGDFQGGFGRQILGETWVSHYGRNHVQSSRLLIEPSHAEHPILRGVTNVWAQSGGYTADPMPGSEVLARGQILDGMTRDAPAARDKKEFPVAWVRTYQTASGKSGRVFTTTHGASEDLLNEGFRRMLVNACLWATGLESTIKATNDVNFVGPYEPTTFGFGGYVKGVKPGDLAGWDSPILPKNQQQQH
jgi:type 1 glutamine amidotransferase